MKVPMLDLREQQRELGGMLKAAVGDVIDSGRYVMGPMVDAFEQEIAAYLGAEHAIGVSSGTDALLIALMALDVGGDDIVITTDYSFFATAGAPARLGAQVVFIDIDPASFNIDPGKLQQWFEENPDVAGNVAAIIPVHLFGQCADMDPIVEIAGKRGIPIIEDAAQAIGASLELSGATRKAGCIGEMAAFSFFPSKNLGALGDGGLVTTNSSELAAKLRRLRVHGAEPKYFHSIVGGNFRLDAIQAAALRVKLPYLDGWNRARQEHARFYDEAFAALEQVKVPAVVHGTGHHIYNQYVITVEKHRDELRQFLAERDVSSAIYYPLALHRQQCFAGRGPANRSFPHSEEAALRSLAIPVYPELTQDMQQYVVDCITEFFA